MGSDADADLDTDIVCQNIFLVMSEGPSYIRPINITLNQKKKNT